MPPTMTASASLPSEPPDPNRRDRTRRLAAQSMAGNTDRYPAGNSLRRQHDSPRRPNANPLAHPPDDDASPATNTPRCFAAELMRLTWPKVHQRAKQPGSSATAAPRKPSAHTKPSVHPPTGHAGHSRPHNETTTFNTNYPAPTRRKIATKPTRHILEP